MALLAVFLFFFVWDSKESWVNQAKLLRLRLLRQRLGYNTTAIEVFCVKTTLFIFQWKQLESRHFDTERHFDTYSPQLFECSLDISFVIFDLMKR